MCTKDVGGKEMKIRRYQCTACQYGTSKTQFHPVRRGYTPICLNIRCGSDQLGIVHLHTEGDDDNIVGIEYLEKKYEDLTINAEDINVREKISEARKNAEFRRREAAKKKKCKYY